MRNAEWKRTERTVARLFGTERNPLSGENSRHNTGSDTLHPRLYIEVKRNKKMNAGLKKVIEDTIMGAKDEGKLPLVAFKIHGEQGFIFVLRSDDLIPIARERLRAKAEGGK